MEIKRQDQRIEEIANFLKRWGLITPGIIFLETNKPFSFLGSQLILFLQPVLSTFVSLATVSEYVSLFENRGNVEKLIQKLETDVNCPTLGDTSWK